MAASWGLAAIEIVCLPWTIPPDSPSECQLRRCIQPHGLATYAQYAPGPGASAPCIWHLAGGQEIDLCIIK